MKPDLDKIVFSLGYNFRKVIFFVKYHTVYGALGQEMFKLPDNFFFCSMVLRLVEVGELNLRF